MDDNRFQSAVFTLKWQGRNIGAIILEWKRGSLCEGRESNLLSFPGQLSAPSMNSSACPSSATTISHLLIEHHLNATFKIVGDNLAVFDIFRLVNTILVDAAEYEPTEQLSSYISPKSVRWVTASFTTPAPPRLNPPFFEIRWLIQAIAGVPAYLASQGRFAETIVSINLDGARVANGHPEARKLPDYQVPVSNRNGSVSYRGTS